MSGMTDVLKAHTLLDADSCSCNEMFYDTRMTGDAILHEHALHVEKELIDAGYAPESCCGGVCGL